MQPGSARSGTQVPNPHCNALSSPQLLCLACGYHQGPWILALRLVLLLFPEFHSSWIIGARRDHPATSWHTLTFLSLVLLLLCEISFQMYTWWCTYLLFIMDAEVCSVSLWVMNEWHSMNTTAIRWSTWAGILIAFVISLTFGQVLYLFWASSGKRGDCLPRRWCWGLREIRWMPSIRPGTQQVLSKGRIPSLPLPYLISYIWQFLVFCAFLWPSPDHPPTRLPVEGLPVLQILDLVFWVYCMRRVWAAILESFTGTSWVPECGREAVVTPAVKRWPQLTPQLF